jgi:hypothetical protein
MRSSYAERLPKVLEDDFDFGAKEEARAYSEARRIKAEIVSTKKDNKERRDQVSEPLPVKKRRRTMRYFDKRKTGESGKKREISPGEDNFEYEGRKSLCCAWVCSSEDCVEVVLPFNPLYRLAGRRELTVAG